MTAVCLACAISACSEPWDDPGPREAFDAFLMHYFRGESELAFEYVLPEDRAALTAPLENAKGLPEKATPEAHEMLVVAEVHNVYDISRMALAEPLTSAPSDGQRVELVLQMQDGSKSGAVMVWQDDRWYVDLPMQEANE